ncbi:ECF transporter S component [Niameybacter massiliensis]|uniref:ECF transporter S component n=1 Tax=Holtiella tumoricola TaxID=3018743 RepID=A0AA42IZX4_9FIRM|nr:MULTISPECIES: ECF transporter S component [Lachnospirales]MDA3730606.1 ECF transporter S component [Holtiella tumoricola]
MKSLKNTKFLTLLGVLLAIEILLAFTPLGFVPLGFTKATTVHIPVIIGAIFLGPVGGAILGLAFGIMSVIINTMTPALTSFVFSPFITIAGSEGNIWSLVIALVPRTLIGITAFYSYKWVSKMNKGNVLAYIVAGVVGSLTNTILVMGGIYLFFGQQYAAAKEVAFEALFGVIMGIVGMNGIPEAIVAAIIVATVCKVLKSIFREKLY